MAGLARVGLEEGGWLLVESGGDIAAGAGPVKAGRVADAIQDMQGTLRAALVPVVRASREALAELRAAGPDEVKVEFGVRLSAAAGAVLTKGEAGGHLKVTLGWSDTGHCCRPGTGPDGDD